MLKDSHTRSMAIMATRHCLIGCGIGEVLGMVISSWLNFGNGASIVISILLAFLFGYSLTYFPLLKRLGARKAASTAFASDTVSITSMELMDNLIIVIIPGALTATLSQPLFWISLAISLIVAFVITVPVNYWLIARGKGHAVLPHEHHHHH